VALAFFTIENDLKGKKRRIMETQKCFTTQNYNLPKTHLKATKIPQDIITLQLISSLNKSQNSIFQKSSY
jgi:hypothetical protein